jgi:sugar O-acyltransferase (sialic acid O-acetyltransferase NeuD family)
MSRIIIVGASDFGRELYGWLLSDSKIQNKNDIFFIDDNEQKLSSDSEMRKKYLGIIKDFKSSTHDTFLLGVSDPKIKLLIVEKLKQQNIYLTSYVHESSIISQRSIVGQGIVVCPFVTVSLGARIGDYTTVNRHSSIAHDVKIGDYCSIMGFSELMGWSELESLVYVGSHTSILPKVKIEEGAKIGAGSVVILDVKSGASVFGNPAREIIMK